MVIPVSPLHTRWLSLFLVLPLLLSRSAAQAAPPAGEGWQEQLAGPVHIWHQPGDAGIAAELAATTPGALRSIEQRTGLKTPPRIDAVLAPSFEQFSALQPGTPPSWAAGTAYAERGELYVLSRMPRLNGDPVEHVYAHELSHVLLGQAFGAQQEPPRWLNEGLARLMAGELSPGDHTVLARAALAGATLPLSSITHGWPKGSGRAQLAYVQAVDFVSWLAEQGDGVLPQVIAGLAAGGAVDAVLVDAVGSDLATLETRWKRRMTFWHAFFPVIGGSSVIWGLTTLLFTFAAWKRRRRFHAQVALMEAEERLAWEQHYARERKEALEAMALWIEQQRLMPPPADDDSITYH